MSYICDFCGESTPPGYPCQKLVTKRVRHFHPSRPKAMKRQIIKNDRKKTEWITDPGGWGEQIEEEKNACYVCAKIQGHNVKKAEPKPTLRLYRFEDKNQRHNRDRRK